MHIKVQMKGGLAGTHTFADEELSPATAEQVRGMVRGFRESSAPKTPGDADAPQTYEVTVTDGEREETVTVSDYPAVNELLAKINAAKSDTGRHS